MEYGLKESADTPRGAGHERCGILASSFKKTQKGFSNNWSGLSF